MRDQFAELEPADRPCQEGDYASIDLSAKADGEEIPEACCPGFDGCGGVQSVHRGSR